MKYSEIYCISVKTMRFTSSHLVFRLFLFFVVIVLACPSRFCNILYHFPEMRQRQTCKTHKKHFIFAYKQTFASPKIHQKWILFTILNTMRYIYIIKIYRNCYMSFAAASFWLAIAEYHWNLYHLLEEWIEELIKIES